jgi:hypothetical protein
MMKKTLAILTVIAILLGFSIYTGAKTKIAPTAGEIGIVTVIGQGSESTEPFVEPTQGFPGETFTITDPQGRMQPGDLAAFYPEGSDPTSGNAAEDVNVSGDGTTLTGKVPTAALQGLAHFISIRPTIADNPRFNDLAFFVRGRHLTMWSQESESRRQESVIKGLVLRSLGKSLSIELIRHKESGQPFGKLRTGYQR